MVAKSESVRECDGAAMAPPPDRRPVPPGFIAGRAAPQLDSESSGGSRGMVARLMEYCAAWLLGGEDLEEPSKLAISSGVPTVMRAWVRRARSGRCQPFRRPFSD